MVGVSFNGHSHSAQAYTADFGGETSAEGDPAAQLDARTRLERCLQTPSGVGWMVRTRAVVVQQEPGLSFGRKRLGGCH